MSNTWVWVVIVVIVLAGGFWWWSMQAPATTVMPGQTNVINTNTDTNATPSNTSDNTGGVNVGLDASTTVQATAPMSATVTYTSSGFTPSTVTIKKGGTVTWRGPTSMNIGSAQHPTHTSYDGTTLATHCAAGYTGPAPFDQCGPGSSYTFTFSKTGTFGYHDHNNASSFGKVVVVE